MEKSFTIIGDDKAKHIKDSILITNRNPPKPDTVIFQKNLSNINNINSKSNEINDNDVNLNNDLKLKTNKLNILSRETKDLSVLTKSGLSGIRRQSTRVNKTSNININEKPDNNNIKISKLDFSNNIHDVNKTLESKNSSKSKFIVNNINEGANNTSKKIKYDDNTLDKLNKLDDFSNNNSSLTNTNNKTDIVNYIKEKCVSKFKDDSNSNNTKTSINNSIRKTNKTEIQRLNELREELELKGKQNKQYKKLIPNIPSISNHTNHYNDNDNDNITNNTKSCNLHNNKDTTKTINKNNINNHNNHNYWKYDGNLLKKQSLLDQLKHKNSLLHKLTFFDNPNTELYDVQQDLGKCLIYQNSVFAKLNNFKIPESEVDKNITKIKQLHEQYKLPFYNKNRKIEKNGIIEKTKLVDKLSKYNYDEGTKCNKDISLLIKKRKDISEIYDNKFLINSVDDRNSYFRKSFNRDSRVHSIDYYNRNKVIGNGKENNSYYSSNTNNNNTVNDTNDKYNGIVFSDNLNKTCGNNFFNQAKSILYNELSNNSRNKIANTRNKIKSQYKYLNNSLIQNYNTLDHEDNINVKNMKDTTKNKEINILNNDDSNSNNNDDISNENRDKPTNAVNDNTNTNNIMNTKPKISNNDAGTYNPNSSSKIRDNPFKQLNKTKNTIRNINNTDNKINKRVADEMLLLNAYLESTIDNITNTIKTKELYKQLKYIEDINRNNHRLKKLKIWDINEGLMSKYARNNSSSDEKPGRRMNQGLFGQDTKNDLVHIPPMHRNNNNNNNKTSRTSNSKKDRLNKNEQPLISRKDFFTRTDLILESRVIFTKIKPNTRSCGTINVIGHYAYMFGGIGTGKLNDMWLFDMQDTSNKHWKYVQTQGVAPDKRYGHSTVNFNNEILIYGGKLEDNTPVLNSITIFDTISNTYINEKTKLNELSTWRSHHIAQSAGNHMIVYGGISHKHIFLSDIILFDLRLLKWLEIKAMFKKEHGIAYHSSAMVVPKEKLSNIAFHIYLFPDDNVKKNKLKYEGIYIFGGLENTQKYGLAYTNELKVLKLGVKPLSWHYPRIKGMLPDARANCTLNYQEELSILILHGGNSGKQLLNDFWILDLVYMQWTKVNLQARVASAKQNHMSFIKDNYLYIFGGTGLDLYEPSEILEVNLDLFNNNRSVENEKNNDDKHKANKFGDVNKFEFIKMLADKVIQSVPVDVEAELRSYDLLYKQKRGISTNLLDFNSNSNKNEASDNDENNDKIESNIRKASNFNSSKTNNCLNNNSNSNEYNYNNNSNISINNHLNINELNNQVKENFIRLQSNDKNISNLLDNENTNNNILEENQSNKKDRKTSVKFKPPIKLDLKSIEKKLERMGNNNDIQSIPQDITPSVKNKSPNNDNNIILVEQKSSSLYSKDLIYDTFRADNENQINYNNTIKTNKSRKTVNNMNSNRSNARSSSVISKSFKTSITSKNDFINRRSNSISSNYIKENDNDKEKEFDTSTKKLNNLSNRIVKIVTPMSDRSKFEYNVSNIAK